jgi:alkanesulfonate monooxygenase SsuD/methylene tetrahydromethanopterin reductase-like flavin-dependent oxidoreductase (luciferase family)
VDRAAPHRVTSFGISVVPVAADYPQIVQDVLLAEREGLDLVGIQDHPYQRRFLDTFALIADLLARTARLRFFPDVASLPMRGATMLAKAAASLDVMSGGRFELGIGAGAFWDSVAGMGGPKRTFPEAFDALEEAIPIIRGALDVGPERRVVRGEGRHYPVPGYPPGPPTAHRVEIWVGAYRPRGLRLIGRIADGWVPSVGRVGMDAVRDSAARIDEAAAAAGRDPMAIRRILNVGGAVTDGARGEGPMDGPADQWVAMLTEWAQQIGVDAFVFWPSDRSSLERYATVVVPAARAALRPRAT